jgi:hypothetical protein
MVAKMVYHPRFMYSDLHPACLQTMFLPKEAAPEYDRDLGGTEEEPVGQNQDYMVETDENVEF